MNKQAKSRLILVFLAVVMAFSAVGCSPYGSLKVTGTQDTSYEITSQGGLAVGYGNYVYFVNGFKSTEDSDGKQNRFGEVVQGGIFRAEFTGSDFSYTDANNVNVKGFTAALDSAETDPDRISRSLYFDINKDIKNPYYYFNLDDKPITAEDEVIDEPYEGLPFYIDQIKTQQIVSKGISADTNGGGGLFIYDNYVYYASRNNEKDKNNTIQDNLYDFYRTRLDGKGTQRLYTTTSGDNIQYAFYKYNGDIYLVVREGTDVVSVKITHKAQRPQKIATGVSEVILPVKDTYYNGISQNTIYDYIFISRAVDSDDALQVGMIAECMRPDGSSRVEILSNNDTLSLVSVKDDSLYFTKKMGLSNSLIRSAPNFSDGITAGEFDLGVQTIFANSDSYTSILPYREKGANGQYNTSDTAVFVAGGRVQVQQGGAVTTLVGTAATLLMVQNSYVYYNQDGYLWRVSITGNFEPEQASNKSLTSNTFFMPDFVNNFMFYTAAQLYDWASDYVFVKRHTTRGDMEEMFIGSIEQENPDIAVHEGHEEEAHTAAE